MLFYNPGFRKVVRLRYAKVKWLFRPIAKMCKFKRFGGSPFLSFLGGGPNHLGTALVDGEIHRIKPRPKKYDMTIFWRRFITDETSSLVRHCAFVFNLLRSDFILCSSLKQYCCTFSCVFNSLTYFFFSKTVDGLLRSKSILSFYEILN